MENNTLVYSRVLDTYEREMRPLIKEFPRYLKEDKELFRIKIHGLKGASRQLGRNEIGDYAEQIENAVKENDITYIESHLEHFIKILEDELEEIAKERDAHLVGKKQKLQEKDSVRKLFLLLRKAFDSYDLKQIEDMLLELEKFELDEEQGELLQQLQQACDELEYEKGSQLLGEMI